MRLALLTAYRGRPDHLLRQRAWLERLRDEEFNDFEWIVVEGDDQPRMRAAIKDDWSQYVFVPMVGPFNKAILLNTAASRTAAEKLCPLDVDLLPAYGTLLLHSSISSESCRILVTGYRLHLAALPVIDSPKKCTEQWIDALRSGKEEILGPEENPSAIRKYLIRGERFGVCPFYDSQDWHAVKGVYKGFEGWGGEDQDLIERVLALGRVLVRCYDLRYFHMPHEKEAGWHDAALMKRNTKIYCARAAKRRGELE